MRSLRRETNAGFYYDCFGIIHDKRRHNRKDTEEEQTCNNRCLIGDHSLAYFPTIGEEKLSNNTHI